MKKYLQVLFLIVLSSLAFAQTEKKTAVAVMDLRGSGISETDAKFLTDRLMIELQRTDVFDVLERDKMAEILKEQGFQQTGACDQASCLVEAGRLLPVQKMIGGSVGKFGDTYSVQIKMIDLKTAKVVKTATKDFSEKMDYLLTVGMANVANMLAGKNKSSDNEEKTNISETLVSIDSAYATIIKCEQTKEPTNRYERALLKEKGVVKYNRVFIDKGSAQGILIKTPLLVLRTNEEKSIKDPKSNKYFKQAIDTVAKVITEVVEVNYSECTLTKAYGDIKVGDKVYKTTGHNK